MTIYFTPPTHPGRPIGNDGFFVRFSVVEGVSVVRDAVGNYT